MKRYRQFVMDGVQRERAIWSNLKGQIYLGDETFVSTVQKRIGKEQDDLNIPKKQKRPIAKPLAEIVMQTNGRNTAIVAAYNTGAYSQREIGEYFQLHPSTVGVIIRESKFRS